MLLALFSSERPLLPDLHGEFELNQGFCFFVFNVCRFDLNLAGFEGIEEL